MPDYFAPMEGLTDRIYRSLHHRFFGGVDCYYMPFLTPTVHRSLTRREQLELPPADSVPFSAVPQLLTKVPEDFLWAAGQCAERGYREVNLNLGCPSGTVVAKGKGAGMLADPDRLDAFLDAIFSDTPLPVSIKTRLGMEDPAEFERILSVYNRYPVEMLIIHPRVRKAFYKGDVDMDAFGRAARQTRIPLCYNGNLGSAADIAAFSAAFPQIDRVMIGRGLIADPGMLCGGSDPNTLQAFHQALLEAYTENFGGPRNAMFRLKENWSYVLQRFPCGEKAAKALRKAVTPAQYRQVTDEIFAAMKENRKF